MNYTLKQWTLFFLCCSFLSSEAAYAIDIPTIDFTGIGPGRVGKNISSETPEFTPTKKSGYLPPPKTTKTPLPKEMYQITLKLNKVIISGNHAISTENLETIFKPFIHQKISLAKLQDLVDSATQKYEDQGYFLSKAYLPPQQIKNGVVHVSVVEGFISKVQVQGIESARLTSFIQKYETNIIGVKPIKLANLERFLLIINDVPGFSVKSVLAPDPKVPLGSVLTLVATYKPFQAMLMRDNYQTRYLGPNESTFYGSINSLALPGGTLYGRVLSSDQYSQLHYYELKHDQTIGTHGLVLTLDAYKTNTNAQFILKPLQLFGTSSDANVAMSYPIIRSRTRSLFIQGQLDYMSNKSTALSQNLYDDEIRDINLTTTYNDSWLKGDNTASFSIDKGLNIWGANNQAFHSRVGAMPDYLKMVLTISRLQYLTDHLSLYALITSQYANRPLFAAETMTFGGPFLGRGYDWSEFTGDQGVAGKTEFRINTTPNLKYLQQVQYYAFYDIGELYSKIPLVKPIGGASAGFGLRSAVMKHLNVETFVGKPLTTPNGTQLILGESGHRFQWYFQVTGYL